MQFPCCVFGVALDQMYFSSDFFIPNHLHSKFIPAQSVLNDQNLTPEEALANFKKIADKLS